MRLKRWDALAFLLPTAVAAVAAIIMFGGGSRRIAEISVGGTVVSRIDLDTAHDGDVPCDTEYNNKIVIKDGCIGVVSADCKDHICVGTGMIKNNGETVVCLPSKLVIRIGEGGQ